MKKPLLFIFAILFIQNVFAQTPSQTVRGVLIDVQTKEPLVGAAIVLDSLKQNAVSTDFEGRFKMNDVPAGRHSLSFTYIGYKPSGMQINVSSGKETVVNIEMQESVVMAKEVVISAPQDKTRVNNEMTTVSSRAFTIEESSRYAGARNDPARMAANFAGVSGANDSRNDIIIRGNSPQGLLWRLNGVDIPSPNHFGSMGSTGGPVGILNNNVLGNSDFMTGAFPAEYGNATSGVFDLKMRKGNDEKNEFMGQIGFNGFELGAEGPFSSKSKASYLINYRYSTLGVFKAIGLNFGTGSAIPQYQDVSFKVDLPTKGAGNFSMFGVGGTSYIELLDSKKDTNNTDLYTIGGSDTYFGSNMGVVGINHSINYNSSAYGKLTIAANGFETTIKQSSVNLKEKTDTLTYGNKSSNAKLQLIYFVVKKFNAKNNLKTGFFFDQLRINLKDSVLDNLAFRKLRNSAGHTYLLRAYTQWQHHFTDNLTLNSGVNYQVFFENNSYAIEPRLGLKWQLKPAQTLSLGAGVHSQIQTIYTYFDQTKLNDGSYIYTNKNLGFSKSNQLVLAYDWSINNAMRIKVETYYQHLYNVPVKQSLPTFSAINLGADFNNPSIDSLINKGTGTNYGFEFTLEKFYTKGYYFLVTTSIFDSKYKGYNGKEYNTVFNGNFVTNALAGKEIRLPKNFIFNIDWKMTYAGGKRYTPINLAASKLAGEAVYDYSQNYKNRFDDYFRTDLKIGIKKNGRRMTQEFSIDMQNITNHQNIFVQNYNPKEQKVVTEYQIGLFVIPQYRITF